MTTVFDSHCVEDHFVTEGNDLTFDILPLCKTQDKSQVTVYKSLPSQDFLLNFVYLLKLIKCHFVFHQIYKRYLFCFITYFNSRSPTEHPVK